LSNRHSLSYCDVMDAYLTGEKLYGDDMSAEEIATWFQDEEEGHYNLTVACGNTYTYDYHALNERHAFRHLPDRRFERVLGFGSARGDELLPIQHRIGSVTIVDPSERWGHCLDVPVSNIKPAPDGKLPLASQTVELVTCFGVLHHIPNVTRVMCELFRCLVPGGYLALREPIISMGDWHHARRWLTKRERGIPLPILRRIVGECGFRVVYEAKCDFALTSLLRHLIRKPPYNQKWVVALDAKLSAIPVWPTCYHATNPLQKLRPRFIALVLQRP